MLNLVVEMTKGTHHQSLLKPLTASHDLCSHLNNLNPVLCVFFFHYGVHNISSIKSFGIYYTLVIKLTAPQFSVDQGHLLYTYSYFY